MTTSAISLESATKYYGQQLGVADLNLEVSQGEVFWWTPWPSVSTAICRAP